MDQTVFAPFSNPNGLRLDSRTINDPALTGSQWIAVSTQKGGVGKTTTCLSLGASLAELGMHVLVVDLDPQANLTQALGVDPESLRHTVGDALLLQATLLEVSRETSLFNLDLAPANRNLIMVEKMLHNTREAIYRLKSCLIGLRNAYYDVVLMDCPSSFGPLTLNALAAAWTVIVPLTCDYYSFQSLHSYLKLLETLGGQTNPGLQVRMLVTMFDGRTRLSRLFLQQLRLRYNELMFETVIPIDVKLRESPMFNNPVNIYAPDSRGAQQYRALAREIMPCLADEAERLETR
jgi:chromosome partitioning protein